MSKLSEKIDAPLCAVWTELNQLTSRFFYYLDESDYSGLVDLMMVDAIWRRQGRVLEGHGQILAALSLRSATQRIRHVVSNFHVTELEGDAASASAYMTAYRYDDGSEPVPPCVIPGPFRFLLVSTRFRREEKGWKIAEQSAIPEFEFTNH